MIPKPTLPSGYRYKPKVYYARRLFDLLHKLSCIKTKTHHDATRAAIMNTKYYMNDIG